MHAGVPTVSVGGLEVGGVGKTPVTQWLLRGLTERGYRPGLLSRGYGRPRRDLVVRGPGESIDVESLGDEPALIAGSNDVPMAIFGDRARAASALKKSFHLDCLVLDDGFAHRRLQRDLDVVVLRPTPKPDRLHLLPWGPLREGAGALRRAGVIWFHARGDEGFDGCEEFANRVVPHATVVMSRSRLLGLEGIEEGEVLLVTGVARPDQVEAALSRAGIHVCSTIAYPDHHRFTPADARHIESTMRKLGGVRVVVTAKDAVKMREWSLNPLVIDVAISVVSGLDDFWSDALLPILKQPLETSADNDQGGG